jgi:hypothetical protein
MVSLLSWLIDLLVALGVDEEDIKDAFWESYFRR